MIEHTFLIPVLRDNDKQPHCPLLWDAFERRLLDFGGFTYHGMVCGAWKDSDGQIIRDESRKYSLAVTEYREREFYDLLREYRPKFAQQCIYDAVTSEHALLVE